MATTKVTLQSVASSLTSLSVPELLSLNKQLIQIVKQRQQITRMQAVVGFVVGEKVTFTDSRAGVKRTCRVDKVKRVMIALTELPGSAEPGKRWNAPGTMLTKVL